MPRYHVTIRGSDAKAMADLVRKHHVDVVRQTARTADGKAALAVAAIADAAQIRALSAAGYVLERHEDVDKAAERYLAEVGKGNRYERHTPRPGSKKRKKSD